MHQDSRGKYDLIDISQKRGNVSQDRANSCKRLLLTKKHIDIENSFLVYFWIGFTFLIYFKRLLFITALVSNVTDAVEMLIQHFAAATDQSELALLGDSKQSPACAKIALNALCPALYAIFRDGLKENIETSFGAVNNSVWQMVEATARQGNELSMTP